MTAEAQAPEVSIIVVHYNTPELTRACVDSILSLTSLAAYEVIVIDNASTLGDISDIALGHDHVFYLRMATNLGFAGGNNAGIQASHGAYALLLNSDTELINDAVTIAYGILEADPGIGILSGQLQYPDGRLQYPTGRFPSIQRELAELLRLPKCYSDKQRQRNYLGDQADHNQALEADWVWGAFWMARRSTIDRLPGGRLPEDFFMYYEDVLWAYLVRAMGLRVVYDPRPQVIHHLSASIASASEEHKYRTRIFPNERSFLYKYKGPMYAKAYYTIKALHLLTLRRAQDREKALWLLKNN